MTGTESVPSWTAFVFYKYYEENKDFKSVRNPKLSDLDLLKLL